MHGMVEAYMESTVHLVADQKNSDDCNLSFHRLMLFLSQERGSIQQITVPNHLVTILNSNFILMSSVCSEACCFKIIITYFHMNI